MSSRNTLLCSSRSKRLLIAKVFKLQRLGPATNVLRGHTAQSQGHQHTSPCIRCCHSQQNDGNSLEDCQQSAGLSVYLKPEALRPTYSSSSSIQDIISTRSTALQSFESKIRSILDALERGHGTIATTIADIGMATHPTEAEHFLALSALAKAKLLNDSEGAIKDALSALSLQPNGTLAKLVYAVEKFNQGDRLSAVSAMHDITETMQLDKCFVADSMMTDIINFLDFLHQDNPADLRDLQQRGCCHVASQDPQQAAKRIDDVTSAIDQGLNTASSFHYRAKAYMLLGKWEAAIEDLSTAHTLHPTDPVVLIECAAATHHIAEYAGSIQDYNLLQSAAAEHGTASQQSKAERGCG